jgi:hypothetical protein
VSVVSGPVTRVLKAFASSGGRLLHGLVRVPERAHVTLHELVGDRPPSIPREMSLTFWLSAPQREPITVPEGSSVSSRGPDAENPVTFATTEDLHIVPCTLTRTATQSVNESVKDTTRSLVTGTGFLCFTEPPGAGDAVYFGLSNAVPACVLSLTVNCEIEGGGGGVDDPPIVWEAWNGREWDACEVALDTTSGLSQPGEILVHVPRAHTLSEIGRAISGWVRARLVPAADVQALYPHAPRIDRVEAATRGGTVDAVLAAPADHEDVDPRSVSELQSSIPFVSRVENRRFRLASPETDEGAEEHMPSAPRIRERPVTEDDYERLALEAAPELARARCLRVGTEGVDAGTVRLLLAPNVDGSQLEIADLMPEPETLERVRVAIRRHSVGDRLVVTPALYQGITIVARLLASRDCNVDELAQRATEALYSHFHPLHGGPAGTGWPFGQDVTLGQAYALLSQVPGCEFVEEAHLFAANPITGERGPDVHRVEVVPEATVFSYAHEIRVDEPAAEV